MKILHYGQIGEIGADGIDRRRTERKDREKKLLIPLVEYFAENNEVTAAKAAELINKSVPTATRYLKKMEGLGVISKEGGSFNTVYRLMRST